jgi:hypothetical protein
MCYNQVATPAFQRLHLADSRSRGKELILTISIEREVTTDYRLNWGPVSDYTYGDQDNIGW